MGSKRLYINQRLKINKTIITKLRFFCYHTHKSTYAALNVAAENFSDSQKGYKLITIDLETLSSCKFLGRIVTVQLYYCGE